MKDSKNWLIYKDIIAENKTKIVSSLLLNWATVTFEGLSLAALYTVILVLQGNRDLQQISNWPAINKLSDFLLSGTTVNILLKLSVTICCLQVAQSSSRYFSRLQTEKVGINAKNALLNNVAMNLLKGSKKTYALHTSGSIIAAAYESPEGYKNAIENLSSLLVSSTMSILYTYVLYTISAVDLAIVILFIAVSGLVQVRMVKRVKAWSRKLARDQSDLGDMYAELTNSINYVKATGTTNYIYKKAKGKIETLLNSQWRRTLVFESVQPISKTFGSFVVAIVVFTFVARNYATTGSMLLPKLAIFLISLQRLSGKLTEVSENVSTLSQNNGRIGLYQEFLDLYDKPITLNQTYASLKSNNDGVNKNPVSNNDALKDLEVKDLSFTHTGELKDTLSGINMRIERGKVVGLVGHSGAGKSTLMNIISGIYKQTKGSVRINGKERVLLDSEPDFWGSRIKLVSQDVFILNDTLLENICFGEKFDASRLDEVLSWLDLTQLIDGLPLGLNTVVGTGGYLLSGGEKQRIGLARALYKQGDLLLLDEPTSALDIENQRKANNAIRFFSSRWATLVITHSQEGAKICDDIYRIEAGSIIEAETRDV